MSSGVMMCGYMGDIYLDIPYDKDLPLHQELEAYLQYSDDRMRFDNVMFLYMPVTIPRQSRGHSGCEPLKAAVRGR